MLRISDRPRRCTRRELLTIGSLGLGGLMLPDLLAGSASAAESSDAVTGKSVIFLFLQGGPSQLETFDPKPEAGDGVRTVTGTLATRVAGIRFGDALPRLAQLADKFTIVRSFQTNNGGHNLQPLVSPDSLEANIGVHYARVVGATQPRSGMPTGTVLYPAAVSESVPRPEARGDLTATGPHSRGYVPFVPGAGGQLQEDMQIVLPHERVFETRRELLGSLDRLSQELDVGGRLENVDALRRQAYELLLSGGISRALDLTREDPRVVARYDTSRFARDGQWDKVNRGKRGYYTAQARTIGKLLLLARRLCEAGCGFVTVHAGYAGVWDMHADGNNLNMRDGMEAVGRAYDHAVAAFIEDVESRGLAERILLVSTGEMGRTPRINPRGGRDHWSKLAPLLLYGGGLPRGTVVGQSTRDGGEPASDPLGPKHLIASLLRTVFDVGRLRLVSGIPREILQLADAEPLPVHD